jgi:hypothetical protein|eukprot:COSAG01_NODE_4524_length_4947_cov_56.073136_3_plen_209_part_00
MSHLFLSRNIENGNAWTGIPPPDANTSSASSADTDTIVKQLWRAASASAAPAAPSTLDGGGATTEAVAQAVGAEQMLRAGHLPTLSCPPTHSPLMHHAINVAHGHWLTAHGWPPARHAHNCWPSLCRCFLTVRPKAPPRQSHLALMMMNGGRCPRGGAARGEARRAGRDDCRGRCRGRTGGAACACHCRAVFAGCQRLSAVLKSTAPQ